MTGEPDQTASARLKRAELASSLGAGLIGFALGMWAARHAADLAIFALAGGLVTHGWGMYDKHAIERRLGWREAPWMAALYWLCWFHLAGLTGTLLYRLAL
ncbi:hypothetical protein [Alteraurantiacibacter palmitatis]|uniref:Uncharacterized protein n=1 Tax=Alteraurantiacibacter palmitatis TaxID=2054628 RepID=A0ABV7E962_9SPHN